MITLTSFQIFELTIGFLTFWVGVHQLSQNVKSSFSWLIFFFFLANAIVIASDPIMVNTPDPRAYIIWQKITDWPLFFMPAFCFNTAVFANGLSKKLKSYLLLAYSFPIFLFFADLYGGLVLKENVLRFEDFRRIDGYAPGILMIPYVIFCVICFVAGIYYFARAMKTKSYKYVYPIIGLSVLTLASIFTGIAFYIKIDATPIIFNISVISGISLNVYFILSYYQLVNNERNIFDRSFLYRTIVLLLIIASYLSTFFISKKQLDFLDVVFIFLLVLLIITSHSLYEWVNTFINDLLYNPSAGLSVVNDQEVSDAIKNYHIPDRLENSSLLRLEIVKNSRKEKEVPVDALRSTIKQAIEYFRPETEPYRRTKQNLKYHLLKMMVFDQAEEGQMLWELGFDEYPVRIMSRENNLRAPLFQVKSPSDYTYTSRNAYLALKKEAIHDVAWRISYLEKLAKRKVF